MKRNLLTYIHDKTGRMLNMTRSERKAENQKARSERRREKLMKKLDKLNQDIPATAAATE